MRNRKSKYQEKILEAIRGKGIHMSAEEVYRQVCQNEPSVGIATVYRQLNSLWIQKRIGRIRDKDQGYIYDGNSIPHHHLHCVVCEQYMDITLPYDKKLDLEVQQEEEAEITEHSIIFEGICKHCKEKRRI